MENRLPKVKCNNHPDINASTQCKKCNIYLCEQCAISAGDNFFLCSQCQAKSIAESIVQRKDQWEKDKADSEAVLEEKQKKHARIRRYILAFIAVAGIIVQFIIYFSVPETDMSVLASSKDPQALTSILDEAIIQYASEHSGKVPNRLDELLGEYLPEEATELLDISGFHYKQLSRYTYELYPLDR